MPEGFMDKKGLLVVAVLVLTLTAASADQTVGLFVNKKDACEGYTLFAPSYWYKTYLINNQGLQVNSWESDHIPGLGGMAYLSDDGCLYRSVLVDTHPVLNGGGPIDGVQKFAWDGTMVWNFKYVGDTYRPHHDFAVMPSGNVLLNVWEIKSYAEAIQAGADKNKLGGKQLFPAYIVEVEPVGPDSGKIVWEWHAWNHLVQDYNPSVDNFGPVYNHPERIDINAQNFLISDFIHINSVDYNEEFDQILLTSPMYGEVWVIDHSTTTEEARGHTGGNYGKGGDLLYRWGNPRFYDHGDMNDQKFFGGHDGNWVDSGCPGAGNIIIFNNGSTRSYSSIDEIVPPVDAAGNYLGTLPWGPADFVWTYTAPNRYDFFVSIICGAQRLPNGNTLTCNAPDGEFFEITPEGDMVWRYIDPVSDSGPVFQGDSISFNSVFKIRRYAPDYPAFQNKDMTPGKPVELYPDDTAHTVTDIEYKTNIKLEIRPAIIANSADIHYQLNLPGHVRIKFYNALGQEVRTLVDESKSAGRHEVRWNGTDNSGCSLGSGVYFCSFQSGETSLQKRIVLIK
jgi:hypothetical protein